MNYLICIHIFILYYLLIYYIVYIILCYIYYYQAVKEGYPLPLPKFLLNLTDEEERKLTREERFKLFNSYVKVDFKLLEDFPIWLEGLKLGDLAPTFSNMHWQDIIQLDGDGLEELGVKPNSKRQLLMRNFRRILRVMVSQILPIKIT